MTETVMVTGAANGIGRAVVKRYLEEGYRVLACDISTDGLDSLEAALPGSNLSLHAVDVADEGQVNRLFESLPATRSQLILSTTRVSI